MKIKKMIFALVSIALCACAYLSGEGLYNPPPRGELLYNLTSPAMLSGEMSTAGGSLFQVSPGYITINPAIPGGEQRIVIDAAYTALIAPSKDHTYGQAFNVGTIIPSRYGVFTGVVQGVFVPFDDMHLQNSGTIRGAYSKDILDSLYVGAGISVAFGDDWGLNLDLGFLYLPDTISWLPFMSDIRLGVSLTGIGKPFNPSSVGIDGTKEDTIGYPGMLTPHFGFAGTFLDTEYVKGGISLDLSFPFFQNLIFDTNVQFLFADIITLSTGWQLNSREAYVKKASWCPSISLGVKINFASKEDSSSKNQVLQESEMIVSGAYKYIDSGVHATSAGAVLYLGAQDTDAPEIILWGNDE